jgi:hypothetical protein
LVQNLPIGSLPEASGKEMHFTGTTVIRVKDGLISEEIGLDDGVQRPPAARPDSQS